MSNIKLRQLLNLTEQAPQPPMADPLSPVAAPVAPPAGMNAGQPNVPVETPPTPDASPEPEDPGEYDFTKDFREFEDKKNKAESDAKKVLLDKMNERLLNKTVVANASRGYGQPKTDYTIKAIKKISVEFWYKDYVVISTDENDKKYFLTPGINIKIESEGSEPSPENQEQPPVAGQEQPKSDQSATPPAGQPEGGQEAPNVQPPAAEEPAPEPQGVQPQPVSPPEKKPAELPPQLTPEKPEFDPRKKKKKVPPVAEWVQKDLNKFLIEFMSNDIKDKNGNVNFIPYIQKASEMLAEGKGATKIKCKLLIPENHMINVDNREIKLLSIDVLRQRNNSGQYSDGSVNVDKNGRYYLLEYIKEVGWNI